MNSSIQIQHICYLNSEADVLKLEAGASVEASQYTEKTITLELEKAVLEAGHLVSLSGFIQIGRNALPFMAIGKVKTSVLISRSLTRVEITLQQFERRVWSQFLESKVQAQKHVDSLLRKIKGDPSHE